MYHKFLVHDYFPDYFMNLFFVKGAEVELTLRSVKIYPLDLFSWLIAVCNGGEFLHRLSMSKTFCTLL